MQLLVPSWYPYQCLGRALDEMLGEPLARAPADANVAAEHVGEHWQFIALLDGGEPVLGTTAIGEALDRRYPTRRIIGIDPIGRAEVRAHVSRIEEMFWCLVMADMPDHPGFGRPLWNDGSGARERMLEEVPWRMDTIELFAAKRTTRFLSGELPSIADAFLAALLNTAAHQGIGPLLLRPSLQRWAAENGQGRPFTINT
ncbi:glutathione S-transferase family protein [Novosphingobium sp. AP12]|uniref:glutathione S-transferase family protein n=1 Tax=Novosphingobium sp. AP12 TaxID=1144305 RepID=UPI000307DCED|nr:glutathione S-transferase family protein [Novosphingobium sp. AP12]